MDLALYARVLLRHRHILLVGVALAVVLAVFSYYRVEMNSVVPKLTPRKAEVWQSSSSVLLTQRSQVVPVPGLSDPGGLARLAGLYARLAMSDDVLRRVQKSRGVGGSFVALPSVDRSSESVLPVVSFLGTGSTAAQAKDIVTRGMTAFLAYVRTKQGSAGIPKKSRVELRILNSPKPAVLVEPRKRTLPIVVFLSVLMAAIAWAFVLENRKRRLPVAEVELRSAQEEVELRPAPQTEVELRPAPPDEVELRPAPQTEVELRPAPQDEVELRPARQSEVALEPEPEAESEPEPVRVRRWA